MKLIIIFGPPAVGKLTVGRALNKRIGYRIIHKQEIFNLLDDFFFFGTIHYRQVDEEIRSVIIREASQVKHIKGIIMTYVWAFNDDRDTAYIEKLIKQMKKRKVEVYFVELASSKLEREERVRGESRKELKKVSTVPGLKKLEGDRDFQSDYRYFKNKNYLKLDNTVLSAEKCASLIIEEFELE